MMVVSKLKHLAKYGTIVVALLAICSIVSLSAHAQTMGGATSAPSTRQIVCGDSLCTIGDPGNGGHQRVCWEAKRPNRIRKGKYKCFYTCQGAGQEAPKDCKKDKYTCRKVTVSTDDCVVVNDGKPMPENYNDRPDKYKKYYEAGYSNEEKSIIPLCPDNGGVSKTTCKCGEGSKQIVCSADRICMKETHTQTDMGQGYSRYTIYTCKIPAGSADAEIADPRDIAGSTGTTFSDYGGMTSTEYTNSMECPTYAQYVEKYGSGCWSCLVLEKLTSSFLSAASAGLKICQEAGIILLILGFAIWLAFWALKNVSSFTEIKGSNILNDLLKIGAKVVLAYFCITAGPTAIREFVITPIIGIGATIAQNFWYTPDDAKASGVDSKYLQGIETQDFDWAEPVDWTGVVMETDKITPQPPEDASETNEETQDGIAESQAIEAEENLNTDIPSFHIPGIRSGKITCYPGCRIPPKTKGKNCGSSAHMGLDIGATEGTPIYAIASGKISYSPDSGPNSWGNVARITTTDKHGREWVHVYAHMTAACYNRFKVLAIQSRPGIKPGEVARDEQIGCVGNTGASSGPHLHLEVILTGKVGKYNYEKATLEPISLGQGKILVRAPKRTGDTFTSDKSTCGNRNKCCECVHNGRCDKSKTRSCSPECGGCHYDAEPNTGITKIPPEGINNVPGSVTVTIGDSYSSGGGSYDYGSMRVEIPDVKYTGPTDIMPKSVMNSILGATKAITFNVAQYQILGEMVMCYSQVHEGGAHHIDVKVVEFYWTNFGMWIAGAILWFLGFMLTSVISFYLVDMSFKIGFAVMALPIVMGLWPFKATQGKLAEVVAIIVKASCDFAFLALTTYFGLNLVAAVYGTGIEGLFNDYDKIIQQTAGSDKDEIVNRLNDTFYLFSSTFLLLLFAIIYAYKLVSQTSKDLVEKFFPDGAFGNVSPMHKALTGAASIINRLNKKYGMGLAGDIAANQLGKGINKLGGKATGAVAAAPKAALNLARRGINKLKGGGKK